LAAETEAASAAAASVAEPQTLWHSALMACDIGRYWHMLSKVVSAAQAATATVWASTPEFLSIVLNSCSSMLGGQHPS
jgi:hypothetical protein